MLNGGSLFIRSEKGTNQKQVERRGFVMDEQVADESVVVIKFEPKKSGNSMEDKTQMILHKLQACKSCDNRYLLKKVIFGCEGMKLNLRSVNDILESQV